MRKCKNVFGDMVSTSSITRKYATGYILTMVLAVVLFLTALLSSQAMSRQYHKAVDELLELNNLFVNVENTDQAVYDYYMYLSPISGESYDQSCRDTRDALNLVLARMDRQYSRDIIDLCYIIDSYLEESQKLIESISQFRAEGSLGDRSELVEAYGECQKLAGFINQNFQKVYTTQLESTQQMQEQSAQRQNQMTLVQISMLMLTMMVSVFFYQRVVRGISRSVNQLIDFATKITEDPACQEHIHLDSGDELTVFANAFNELLDRIHGQMDQIQRDSRIREQLQKAEVENLRISSALQSSQLRLLQARINPHFLFNTLNMITQMAHVEEAEETAHLMEATAEFLRYNLGKVTKSVTLADEIENTRNYVYIQRCRFGERISFLFEIEDDCTGLEIPCMILQPLVENAVSHGVGAMISGGKVTVSLKHQQDKICLEVADNGIGFDQERLERIQTLLATDVGDDGHIGLYNVYQRLRLFFGAGLQFEVESVPGSTVVRMLLPQ